jgi:hypothetical protein
MWQLHPVLRHAASLGKGSSTSRYKREEVMVV